MKFLGFACLAVLLGVSSAGEQMQINYYSNSECTQYESQVDVNWASRLGSGQSNCYNWSAGNSVNIANCYEGYCICYFYNQGNCGGNGAVIVANSDSNCLQNASGYYSFGCYYS